MAITNLLINYMKKPQPIICLPTDKASNLHTAYYGTPKESMYVSVEPFIQEVKDIYKSHFLYILSDEPIKEGDWCIDIDNNTLVKCDGVNLSIWNNKSAGFKKIIATSNPELNDSVKVKDRKFVDALNSLLPTIPLSLIEHYAKYQPKEMMVEYGKEPIFNEEGKTVNSKWQLKLTPSGEICWSPVEDFVNEEIGKIPAYGTGLTAEESKQKEVDVEKLAIIKGEKWMSETYGKDAGSLNASCALGGFVNGYSQALQSSDKMFSLEDMMNFGKFVDEYYKEQRMKREVDEMFEEFQSLTKEQETKK